MSLSSWFTDHPRSVGESYLEHAAHSAGFGAAMLRGALATFVHALLPAVCTTTGSRTIARLHDRMIVSRARLRSLALSQPTRADFLAEHI